MDLEKMDWRKVSELNKPAPERSVRDLRLELAYQRRKRKFIAAGNYLPATTLAYQRACNMSYRAIVKIRSDESQVLLDCGDWADVPPANPLTKGIGESRFCSRCADAAYRAAMLDEIDGSIKQLRSLLHARTPWWMRILTAIVVCTLAAGLSLQAWASWHGTPHVVGAFDPRSDENADGSCP
jgi:hypothetical protein